MTGLVLIGVAGGYTLLSSIFKEQGTYTRSAYKNNIAKVITIVILATFFIYISASGIIHPIKLIEVNAEIVDHGNRSGYQVNEGTETVYFKQTEIRYTIVFKNMSNTRLKDIRDNNKIWIEPDENLVRLFEEGFLRNRTVSDLIVTALMRKYTLIIRLDLLTRQEITPINILLHRRSWIK